MLIFLTTGQAYEQTRGWIEADQCEKNILYISYTNAFRIVVDKNLKTYLDDFYVTTVGKLEGRE